VSPHRLFLLGIDCQEESCYLSRVITLRQIARFFGPELPAFQVMYLTGRTLKKVDPMVCPIDEDGCAVRDDELYEVTVKRIRKVI